MYISGIIDKLEKQHRIVAILAHSEIHCQQAQRIAQAVFVPWACLRQFYHITTPLHLAQFMKGPTGNRVTGLRGLRRQSEGGGLVVGITTLRT